MLCCERRGRASRLRAVLTLPVRVCVCPWLSVCRYNHKPQEEQIMSECGPEDERLEAIYDRWV